MHCAIEQVLQRADNAKSDSDFSYFFSLLLAGEALAKTVVLGMIAALGDEKERNRYRLEHAIIHSDGLGDWSRALEDALTGPASQYLLAEARVEQTELTRLCRQGEWQYTAVIELKSALNELEINAEDVPIKSDMKKWFRLFATLRNKTRAHGATIPSKASKAIPHLEKSIDVFSKNISILKRPWAFFYRNISGKYRISSITGNDAPFEYLRKEPIHKFRNGIYIYFGIPRFVPLMHSDPELRDFFFSNGGLTGRKFELLSYTTDDKTEGDATEYSAPPGSLPASDTQGHGELLPKGKCFSNVPELIQDYVCRPQLESELRQLLLDDRRAIVTLIGKGGIGKTSLSIRVIQELYEESPYSAIIWLSARDIDLQLSGPKPVRPFVVSSDDMAELYASLVLSADETQDKDFNAKSFFERQLEKNDLGPCLFVFDNFETTQNPVEMFNWVDCYIRLPNKALITTRMRDFKGDYPVEIGGMNDKESRALIAQTSTYLNIGHLLTREYITDLVHRSEGHPYVIKILLGDVAKAGRTSSIDRIVAGSDEILTALFERTYASLSPCAQRAFMTLAAWNSSVPRLALEAVLMRSVSERQEVEKGVEALIQFSMAEMHAAPTDQQPFIRLPMVARAFGKKKLNISPFKVAIQSDVEILQMLGPSRPNEVYLGLARRLEVFIANIARRIDSSEAFEEYTPILEMICRSYNPGWLLLARWHLENESAENNDKAKEELRHYLEKNPSGEGAAEAWRMLARACYKTGDALGEIHAFIERAQLESAPFYDISSTANRLNNLLREQDLGVGKDHKRHLAQRLLTVLEKRKVEACADDFSRMAWLALHVGQEDLAGEFARAGIKLEPENYHCCRISEKLGA